ncbi:MAG: DUF192 domain-containing protein [Sandaracinaceae bacterium]
MTRGAAAALAAATLGGCACPPAVVEALGDGEVLVDVCAPRVTGEAGLRRGLRGAAPLRDDEGLLLVLPTPRTVCIDNDGVTFPVDAVYAADNGTIVARELDIPAHDPLSRCHGGTRRILEVASGVAADVRVGDRLLAP